MGPGLISCATNSLLLATSSPKAMCKWKLVAWHFRDALSQRGLVASLASSVDVASAVCLLPHAADGRMSCAVFVAGCCRRCFEWYRSEGHTYTCWKARRDDCLGSQEFGTFTQSTPSSSAAYGYRPPQFSSWWICIERCAARCVFEGLEDSLPERSS